MNLRVISLCLTLLLCSAVIATADIPHNIAYQGRLTDTSGVPREGSFAITFRIYDAEAAGTMLWEETHPNVTVSGGIFDILLGSITPLDLSFDAQYYLAIQVGGDPEMIPRQIIASSGYAYRAETAGLADEAAALVLPAGTKDILYHDNGWQVIPATNGEILCYNNGWQRISAPSGDGMHLVSKGAGQLPEWEPFPDSIVFYEKQNAERDLNTSFIKIVEVDVVLTEERYIEFDAYFDLNNPTADAYGMARVTIDGARYGNIVQRSSNRTDHTLVAMGGWVSYQISAGMNEMSPPGTYKVRLEGAKAGTAGGSKIRNAKLRVVARR